MWKQSYKFYLPAFWNPEKGVERLPDDFDNRMVIARNPEKGVERSILPLLSPRRLLNPEKGVESAHSALSLRAEATRNPEKGVESCYSFSTSTLRR